MTNPKNLLLSLALTTAAAVSVLAGETPTPPCVPGELNSPPCTSQSVNDDSTTSTQTSTSSTSNSLDLVDLAEDVAWSLLLF